MDLRVKRTKKSISDAYVELRAKKPLEKITIKELADLAFINKATFYQHYKDIYDLADAAENELINEIVKNMPDPELIISEPKRGFEQLIRAVLMQSSMIDIIFSGSRRPLLSLKLEESIKELIYRKYPDYKNDMEKDVLFTVLIQGTIQAFIRYSKETPDRVIEILGRINDKLLSSYDL